MNILIPPLRERIEELPKLVDYFLRRGVLVMEAAFSISDELLDLFNHYAFPGNVRELENMIKRIVVLESEASVTTI